MQVEGMDIEREAYRISFEAGGATLRGLVPETVVMEVLALGRRPGHEEVYRFLDTHRTEIETALTRKRHGTGPIRSPYDRLSVLEETE